MAMKMKMKMNMMMMMMFRSMLRMSGVFYPYVYSEVLFLFIFYRLRKHL